MPEPRPLSVRARLSPRRLFWLALALRLAFVLALPAHLLGSWDSDSQGHLTTARTLADHGVYGFKAGESNAFCPPGFIWMITPLAAVFHSDANLIRAGRILHAVMGAVVVYWTALLASILGGAEAGALAGLLAAFSPPLVLYCGTLMTDSAFTFVQCAAILAFVRLQKNAGRGAFVAGLLGGLATLVREPAIGLAPMAAAALPWALPRKTWPGAAGALLAGWLLALAPWTARNWIEFHRLAPATLRGPSHLYVSQHIPEDGVWVMDGDRLTRESSERMDASKPWGKMAVEEMLTNPFKKPAATLRMWAVKFQELWLHPSGLYQLRSRPALYFGYLSAHLGLLALCALGAWTALRRRAAEALFPLLALAYTTAFHVLLTFPLARYFVPMLPFVCLFAGLGLAALLKPRQG